MFCRASWHILSSSTASKSSPQSTRIIGGEATIDLSYLGYTVKAAFTDAMSQEMMKKPGGGLSVACNRYRTDPHPLR